MGIFRRGRWFTHRLAVALCLAGLLQSSASASDAEMASNDEPVGLYITDAPLAILQPGRLGVSLLFQDQPPLRPRLEFDPRVQSPAAANQFYRDFFATYQVGRSLLSSSARQGLRPSTDLLLGIEAKVRATTDSGALLGKSPSVIGVGLQRRTPIVNDPRLRGSRVGRLAASGSHWVPARIDLDTILSKIDASVISDIAIIKGPFSSLYGPGFAFMDVQLVGAPRFEEGPATAGSTLLDFRANGSQWHGRQTVMGGDQDWGYRFGYSHRTGTDYVAGDGTPVASSYNSRMFDFTIGRDLDENQSIDFTYLRLDQTDVEFPGMAFDIDFLVTDGFELTYENTGTDWTDELTFETWHNHTRFSGNAQSAAKRQQFPLLDFFQYEGFTDVDSTSTGFRAVSRWEVEEDRTVIAGVDLRYIRQELDEVASGRVGFNVFTDANSPIPKSDSMDPGFFVEDRRSLDNGWSITSGGRIDVVGTDVRDDPAELAALGLNTPQSSFADIVGSDQFEQNFMLWMGFITASKELNETTDLDISFGFAQQAPSLTELYAAESFLFLLQNGQNTATGDPTLKAEDRFQLDVGVRWDKPDWRGKLTGFHIWANDYITFENIGVFNGPPAGQPEQVSLKFVNTSLATLAGVEFYGEYDYQERVTLFGNLSYVEGTDRTRNGTFATNPVSPGSPSQQVPGQPRGFFSGVSGSEKEPLPSILPLQSIVGIRLHAEGELPKWGLEISARMVTSQDRVAASLLESTTDGFTTWDLRAFIRRGDNLTFWLGVENLTDRHYREHLDFRSPSGTSLYQPGASFYVTSELTY
jgi:outer membrane receptor protein involved in Fe transport